MFGGDECLCEVRGSTASAGGDERETLGEEGKRWQLQLNELHLSRFLIPLPIPRCLCFQGIATHTGFEEVLLIFPCDARTTELIVES